MIVQSPAEQLRLDPARTARTGVPEIVYGDGKAPAHCAEAVQALLAGASSAVLASRVDRRQAEAICEAVPAARYDEQACAVVARPASGSARLAGAVSIAVLDGASRLVAAECALVLRALGADVEGPQEQPADASAEATAAHRRVAGTDGQAVGATGHVRVLLVPSAPQAARRRSEAGMSGSRAPTVVVPTSLTGRADPAATAELVRELSGELPGAVFVNVDGGIPAALVAGRVLRARERLRAGG